MSHCPPYTSFGISQNNLKFDRPETNLLNCPHALLQRAALPHLVWRRKQGCRRSPDKCVERKESEILKEELCGLSFSLWSWRQDHLQGLMSVEVNQGVWGREGLKPLRKQELMRERKKRFAETESSGEVINRKPLSGISMRTGYSSAHSWIVHEQTKGRREDPFVVGKVSGQLCREENGPREWTFWGEGAGKWSSLGRMDCRVRALFSRFTPWMKNSGSL